MITKWFNRRISIYYKIQNNVSNDDGYLPLSYILFSVNYIWGVQTWINFNDFPPEFPLKLRFISGGNKNVNNEKVVVPPMFYIPKRSVNCFLRSFVAVPVTKILHKLVTPHFISGAATKGTLFGRWVCR